MVLSPSPFGIDVHFRRDLGSRSLILWEQEPKGHKKYPGAELFLEKICLRSHILTKSLQERAISFFFSFVPPLYEFFVFDGSPILLIFRFFGSKPLLGKAKFSKGAPLPKTLGRGA